MTACSQAFGVNKCPAVRGEWLSDGCLGPNDLTPHLDVDRLRQSRALKSVVSNMKRLAAVGSREWTEQKLRVITSYLTSDCTALKNQGFSTTYIDAFAGTGYRADPPHLQDETGFLFPDLAEAPSRLLSGSARRALECDPPFDRYEFIELDPERCRELRRLASEFSDRSYRITIHEGDANQKVPVLCNRDWHGERARGVVFLDPYGMQVRWATIEAIAATRAIDLWVLFPLGVAVNRLVTRSRQFPPGWRDSLNRIFGTTAWEEAFYETKVQRSLLGGHQEQIAKVSVDVIGAYFNERLKNVFAGVAAKPAVLRNSVGNPIYLLCFAVANPNPRAQGLALKIADHLLRDVA